jgi:transcriptional regulator with XRE-family HTH domain
VFSGPSHNGESAGDLGTRVRSLRRERGLTLKGLGRLAELSHPFLSQVERGLANPSVTSMERIAAALGVPVSELWSPPRRRDAVRLVRHGEGVHAAGEPVLLLRELFSEPGGPLVREWSAANRRWPATPEVLAGDVLVYVARGALDVDLDGSVQALDEGDALLFDGAIPHRLRRRGSATSRALIVSTPRA